MELGNQFGLAIIVAYLLEALKHLRGFPLLTEAHTRRYKTILGGLAAFCVTVGIHYAFDYNATGHGVLTIVLPTWAEAGHAVLDFAKQWAFQQGAYDSMVRSKDAEKILVHHVAPSSLPQVDISGRPMPEP